MLLDTSCLVRPTGSVRARALSLVLHAGVIAGGGLFALARSGDLPAVAAQSGANLVVTLPAPPPVALVASPGRAVPRQARALDAAPALPAAPRVPSDTAVAAPPLDDPGQGCLGCTLAGTGSDPAAALGAPDGDAAGVAGTGGPTIGPLRVGHGGVVQPVKVSHVDPEYPELARRARIEGKVVIDCVIGTRGAVEEARVLSGPPLLVEAAVAAVGRWRYRPTLLDGVPVAVAMTVTVRFHLR